MILLKLFQWPRTGWWLFKGKRKWFGAGDCGRHHSPNTWCGAEKWILAEQSVGKCFPTTTILMQQTWWWINNLGSNSIWWNFRHQKKAHTCRGFKSALSKPKSLEKGLLLGNFEILIPFKFNYCWALLRVFVSLRSTRFDEMSSLKSIILLSARLTQSYAWARVQMMHDAHQLTDIH